MPVAPQKCFLIATLQEQLATAKIRRMDLEARNRKLREHLQVTEAKTAFIQIQSDKCERQLAVQRPQMAALQRSVGRLETLLMDTSGPTALFAHLAADVTLPLVNGTGGLTAAAVWADRPTTPPRTDPPREPAARFSFALGPTDSATPLILFPGPSAAAAAVPSPSLASPNPAAHPTSAAAGDRTPDPRCRLFGAPGGGPYHGLASPLEAKRDRPADASPILSPGAPAPQKRRPFALISAMGSRPPPTPRPAPMPHVSKATQPQRRPLKRPALHPGQHVGRRQGRRSFTVPPPPPPPPQPRWHL